MDILDGLNKEQREAVLTDKQYVRVIAGAGSGKTRVLTTRIVHLITERHIMPWSICAITFTNKAANEMKERMERMHPDALRVHTSTIHSLCVRILREDYDGAGLVKNFTILDRSDQESVLREAYRHLEYERKSLSFNDALNYISNNKTAGVDTRQAAIIAGENYYEKQKANIFKYYDKKLKAMYALDFDDLLIVVNDMLKNNTSVRLKWQSKFKTVLVDEFQDVDHIQYGIIKSLVGENNELYVVGDPDQTIYTWRGANVDFIVDFEKTYKHAITIVLNQNYRSTQHILNRANRLIECNQNRPPKELYANKESDFDVEYDKLDDADAEAYFIVRKIQSLKEESGRYLDTAVLYRSNYLSRSIEKQLMSRNIPYVIYGGLRFYDHAEIKDLMSYLRMLSHGDDIALRRSVSIPRRGIGDKTLDAYADRAIQTGSTIFEEMVKDVKVGKATNKIKDYVDTIYDMRDQLEGSGLEHVMRYVLNRSGLMAHYERLEEMGRVDNLKELISDAIQFEKNYEDSSLDAYLQMVSLYGEKENVVEGDYIRLMTVHAAKGLEFNNVIIMGVVDNIFPSKRAVIEGVGGIEEERRLMYVAITRAKEKLFITSNNGYNYVAGGHNKPSRFIREMGMEPSDPTQGVSFSAMAQEAVRSFETSHGVAANKRVRYKKGEVVIHDEFGEGIVIVVNDDENTLRIAFNFPHGTKTISNKFSGIHKKGMMS